MLIIGAVLLEGKSSEFFSNKQEVAQGCTLSPTVFSINGLLCETENRISDNTLSSLLFAGDFVGVAETG